MAAKQSGKPTRPRHVPQRTCVACRRSEAKGGLIRIVRDAEGRLAVDPSGRQRGRGAYLCSEPACWELALKRRALERALRIETIHPEDRATLLATARRLAEHTEQHVAVEPNSA